MSSLFFDRALLSDGWRDRVRIDIANGTITAVAADANPDDAERHGIGIPGIANVHSHGFQRGMAGLAEVAGPESDNFWTWREIMYRFLATMTPDDVEAITALAYAEMIESGFTSVGEFHYLHNDPSGRPYADPAELSRRVVAAADMSGIGLSLLPSFYAHSSFGGAPPTEGQRRFVTGVDGFARILEGARQAVGTVPGGRIGIAPHSLRAVTPEELAELLALEPTGPVHMHVAEQTKEVADCEAWSGKRPVEWLLDNVEIDRRWCLIHLTHITDKEISALAASGAVAGLCAVTEANLGDGIFNAPTWIGNGGRYAVGTDSNVMVGLAAELRQLEYAQRLGQRARNILGAAPGRSTGRALVDATLVGGAFALDRGPAGLVAGASADIVALSPRHHAVAERDGDGTLDAWIFADDVSVDSVWRAGKLVVRNGRHVDRDRILARFGRSLRRLTAG